MVDRTRTWTRFIATQAGLVAASAAFGLGCVAFLNYPLDLSPDQSWLVGFATGGAVLAILAFSHPRQFRRA